MNKVNKVLNSFSAAKVTTVEKTEKVKDPRKVELGKRLAKISEMQKKEKQEKDSWKLLE